MQKKGANISLKGYDDIFSTDQSRAEAQQERVQEIPLSELHPFEGHPFRVVDDEDMMKTVESVRDFGVLTPAIVRPDPDGGYEIISGHRRHRASELAGKETMPVIVRDTPMRTATSVKSGKPLTPMPKQRKESCRSNTSRKQEPLFLHLLRP